MRFWWYYPDCFREHKYTIFFFALLWHLMYVGTFKLVKLCPLHKKMWVCLFPTDWRYFTSIDCWNKRFLLPNRSFWLERRKNYKIHPNSKNIIINHLKSFLLLSKCLENHLERKKKWFWKKSFEVEFWSFLGQKCDFSLVFIFTIPIFWWETDKLSKKIFSRPQIPKIFAKKNLGPTRQKLSEKIQKIDPPQERSPGGGGGVFLKFAVKLCSYLKWLIVEKVLPKMYCSLNFSR